MSFAERHLLPYRDRRRIEVTSSTFSGVPMMLTGTLRIAVLQERLAVALCEACSLHTQPLPFDMPLLREMVQYHSARENDAGISWLVDEFVRVASRPLADGSD
jgi:DNA-binding transcriptional LysR family regulator